MVTRRRKIIVGVAIGACLVAVLAVTALLRPDRTTPQSPAVSREPVITYSTDKPNESKDAAAAYNWQGSAREPKRITVPSLGIDAFIQKSGVDQNKQIAVPSNVHLASWFADSVLPGSKGLSIIAGHVSGRAQPGVFEKLSRLQKDSEFTITYGDNSQKTFQVISSTSVPTAESANLLFSQDPSVTSQVNLVTCAGDYDKQAGSYDERVIVSAAAKQ